MANQKVAFKKDWISNFHLIGKPKIAANSFTLNKESEKSSWVGNSMNLAIDCGERNGFVFTRMFGGYSKDNPFPINVHGKDVNNRDDFSARFPVAWEDRLNEDILDEIGDLCFIKVGIEKTTEGNTFVKRFLSEYDAIEYIQKHLTNDMVISVRGQLSYSYWDGKLRIDKNIKSIYVTDAAPSDYKATFTQSILIDKDSTSMKEYDKDKNVVYVNAKVLDYLKEHNGIEVKGQFPYNAKFEFAMPENSESHNVIMNKMFKVKKGITQITFEGEFIESGATVQPTWDDVPDDIRDLVEIGYYSKEEALAKCSANGATERRMVMTRPMIRMVGEEGSQQPVIQRFEERYTEDDLLLDCMLGKSDELMPWEEETGVSDNDALGSDDWLAALKD